MSSIKCWSPKFWYLSSSVPSLEFTFVLHTQTLVGE